MDGRCMQRGHHAVADVSNAPAVRIGFLTLGLQSIEGLLSADRKVTSFDPVYPVVSLVPAYPTFSLLKDHVISVSIERSIVPLYLCQSVSHLHDEENTCAGDICLHLCMHTLIHAWVFVQMCALACVWVCVFTCVCVLSYVCIFLSMCLCIRMCRPCICVHTHFLYNCVFVCASVCFYIRSNVCVLCI